MRPARTSRWYRDASRRSTSTGDGIPVAQTPDGGLYVALRPITDHLGLAFGSQRNRVLRDRVMAPRVRTVLMTAADGRQRELLCLPLDLVPGFLFGITTGKVRPDLVDKLEAIVAEPDERFEI